MIPASSPVLCESYRDDNGQTLRGGPRGCGRPAAWTYVTRGGWDESTTKGWEHFVSPYSLRLCNSHALSLVEFYGKRGRDILDKALVEGVYYPT